MNEALIMEAMQYLAQKMVNDMKQQGLNPTKEEVQAAIEENWPKISENIAKLVAAAQSVAIKE